MIASHHSQMQEDPLTEPSSAPPLDKSSSTTETSPFLPRPAPNNIQSIPIALAPAILPLTYNPKQKQSKRRNDLSRCRGIVTWIILFLLLTILVHYVLWLCLKKDKDMSLIDFMLH